MPMNMTGSMEQLPPAWNSETQKAKVLIGILCVVLLFIFLVPSFTYAQEQVENIQFFGSEPAAGEKDKGRSFLECLKGWRQFIAATSPFDPGNFDEYWKEIFYVSWRSPALFADIVNIEEQVNRARYAVMAAFLRCDLDRLKSVTEAYFRLEAELYYVRHSVDTSGGYVQKREDFANELADYLIVLKAAEDPEKERAIYSGYFDLFKSKYAERVKIYADSSNDPIFAELGAKFDELMETFKSFKTLGSEMANLGSDVGEAVVEGASAVGGAVASFENPGKALKDLGGNLLNRFKICPATGHPDECKNIYGLGTSTLGYLFGAGEPVKKLSEKKTYEDVKKVIKQIDIQAQEDAAKAEMLLRYELLYGQVGGEGVLALMARMDKLLGILGSGDTGSLQPLKKADRCAENINNRVCSD